jgi:hypothetical protein
MFLDPTTLKPVEDQWVCLYRLPRVTPEVLASMVDSMQRLGAGPEGTAYLRPRSEAAQKQPATIHARSGAILAVERRGVPPALLSALKHPASLHNPEYYEKERLRFSTWNTPRLIRCYGESIDGLLLPRGVRERAASIVAEDSSQLVVHKECGDLEPVGLRLQAEPSAQQKDACDALARHEQGCWSRHPGPASPSSPVGSSPATTGRPW